jgi:hypothetical protein
MAKALIVVSRSTASIRRALQPSTPIRVRTCLKASGLFLAVGPAVFGLRPMIFLMSTRFDAERTVARYSSIGIGFACYSMPMRVVSGPRRRLGNYFMRRRVH